MHVEKEDLNKDSWNPKVTKDCHSFFRDDNRELKQTRTTTAMRTSLNKMVNEQNNSCARAL